MKGRTCFTVSEKVVKKYPKSIQKQPPNETKCSPKRTSKKHQKKVCNFVENDPKMTPILGQKTSKMEQKRCPKWDPLQKMPKGSQIEPKWLQNDLKMEAKLSQNASNMLPEWCPTCFKIVRNRTCNF